MYAITDDRSLMDDRVAEAATALALTHNGVAVAEIAIEEHETCPPEVDGSLPPTELVVTRFGFDSQVPDGEIIRLIGEARRTVRPRSADYIRYRVNPEFVAEADRKRHLVESAGMRLFAEKRGFHLDLSQVSDTEENSELHFRSLDEVGAEDFVPVIASIGFGTLDRNDRWFHERAGAENWARVFLAMRSPSDRSSWLVGFGRSGDAVGFIGVSSAEIDNPTPWDSTPCATISMTGVVPEHRGRGHIQTVLRAGISAAKERGFAVMLDSVDVLNAPMLSVMARSGYRDDVRPWHDWFYRAPVNP